MTIALIITVIAAVLIYCMVFKKFRPVPGKTGTAEADAIILNSSFTAVREKDRIQAFIQLQVLPAKNKNFVCDIKQMLSIADYTNVQPGKKVKVKYNPHNHKEMLMM